MNRFIDDIIHLNNARILSGVVVQPRYVPDTQPDGKSREKSNATDVNDLHKRFLMAVYNSQYKMTLTEVSKIAGFPAGTGSRIADECVKRNLIKLIRVPFGRGRPTFPVLLPDAYMLLGVQERPVTGRGAGHDHTLYQHLIAEHFKEFNSIIELNRNKKFIDVALELNELFICIEVAMTSVHEQENIKNDFSLARADAVIVACINDKILSQVRDIVSKMPETFRKNTRVLLLSELLKMKPDELHQTALSL